MKFFLYAIQSWKVERWFTFYVTSYLPDAVEAFGELTQAAPERELRLVSFTVDDFEFLSTAARDYQALALSAPELESA